MDAQMRELLGEKTVEDDAKPVKKKKEKKILPLIWTLFYTWLFSMSVLEVVKELDMLERDILGYGF